MSLRAVPEGVRHVAGPFDCPFCGGTFSIAETADDERVPMVLHSIPKGQRAPDCEEYNRDECPSFFLQRVNKRKAN